MSTTTHPNSFGHTLFMLAVATVVILIAVWFINLPDHRTAGERVGNAIDNAPTAVSKTADKIGKDLDAPATTHKVDSAFQKMGNAMSAAASEVGADLKAASDKQKEQNRENDRKKASEE